MIRGFLLRKRYLKRSDVMKKNISIFLLTIYVSLCFLASASLASPYVLESGDILEVKIFHHGDLDTRQEIGPNGKVALPYLGRVTVSGMSLSSFEVYAAAELGKYIKDVNIAVYLTPRPIFVVQHYLKTDTYMYHECKTIDEAKAYAGEDYTKEIHYGDTIRVDIGNTPTWWDNNWVAIISATAVLVGMAIALR
jgi:protein involved in polysaccharide export with SLBB domain